MAERPIAPVLKTGPRKGFLGSNPSLTVGFRMTSLPVDTSVEFMRRRPVAGIVRSALTASLLICVLLAGCSGVPVAPENPFQRTPDPPYESPNGTTVASQHGESLAAVETATRRVDIVEEYTTRDGEQRTVAFNETRHVDYTSDPPTAHLIRGDGREVWMGSDRQLSRSPEGAYDVTEIYDRNVSDPALTPFDFDGPEQVSRDGRTLYRYTAVRPESYYASNTSTTILSANVTILVRPDGLVVNRTEVVRAGTRFEEGGRLERTITYSDINDTIVERPPWYDEAVAELTRVTAPSVNATLHVSAPPPSDASEPELGDHGFVLPKNVVGPRVSCVPQVDLPGWIDDARLTIGYQDRYVPAGDEGNLTLYRVNDTYQTFLAVGNATVDASANRVTARIDQSGYYAVLHRPTWQQMFDRSETPDSETDVPDCGSSRDG